MTYRRSTLAAALLLLSTNVFAQERVVPSFDGVPIHFDVDGDRSPALILVHGWSNNRTYWQPHVQYFSEKYQVVTLDLAGFGESGNERQAWTMAAFGEDVTAVVETLDLPQVVLVGFSMGGPVVLEAAKRIPRRQLAGVVLVDILHDIDYVYSQDEIDAIVEAYRLNLNDPDYLRNQGAFSPETDDELVQRYLNSHADGFPERWWTALENTFHWINDQARPTLLEIEAPIAAINSDRSPTNVEAFRRYAPSFAVRLMPDVGHIGVIWEKTDLFQQLLDEIVQAFMGQSE